MILPWIRLALILVAIPFVFVGIVYAWDRPYFPIITALKKASPMAFRFIVYVMILLWLVGTPNSPELSQAGWSFYLIVIVVGGSYLAAVSALLFEEIVDLVRVRVAAFILLRKIKEAYLQHEQTQKEIAP